jgi:adenylate cyclase class IV
VARNLELKVRCTGAQHERAKQILAAQGGSRPMVLWQRDTYFRVSSGRLKFREIDTNGSVSCELIQYRRPDIDGMRESSYRLTIIPNDQAPFLRESLTDALGLYSVVEKRRTVVLWQRTRVHLDDVAGLGTFLELETVLDDDPGAADRGQIEYNTVVDLLELASLESVPGSYSDLIAAKDSSL